MRSLIQDLRYGFRMLAKRPGFTAIAVLALALGIGANTAVFSVIRGVLLRPLPYADPDRLVVLWESNLKSNAPRESTSAPNFLDWRAQNQSFVDMAAAGGGSAALTEEGEPEILIGTVVTTNYFNLLGVNTVMGRGFSPEDSEQEVIVISDSLWHRRFGSDPTILSRRVRLGGTLRTVIGVMPPGFHDPDVDGPRLSEFWRTVHKADFPRGRRNDNWRVLARLKPGVPFAQGRAEMTAIGQRLALQYPGDNAAWTLETVPLTTAIAGDVRTPLWLLLGSAALLLLIACANVANLCLARSSERRREFAIRSALGGGSARLFRQLITESLALSLLGGVSGLLVGIWTMRAMLALGGAFIPRAEDVRLDPWIMLFAFATACVTGVLFGALPARQAARTDLNESLKAAGRGAVGPGRGRARALLVVSEVGLTLVLLVAAGLLLRSFWQVQAVPLGFEPSRLLTADLRLPGLPGNPALAVRFLGEFASRIERLPGVTAVAAINAAPLSGRGNELSFNIEGRPAPSDSEVQDAFFNAATPGYLNVMGIKLLRGRLLAPSDTAEAPKVGVISDGMVRQYFATEDPLGRRFTYDGTNYYTIVGVVADVHHEGFTTTPKAHVYLPYPQFPLPRMTVTVRASLDPLTLVSAVRGELRAMDKDRPLTGVKTEEALMAESVAPRRFALVLIGVFAGLALLVASIGIYGVISYSVTECTQEFGVRMAMGAMRRDVLGMVLWRGLRLAGAGIAAGAVAALVVTRVMQSFLFGVTAHDAVTFFGVAGIFLAVSLAACLIPARRATRVDPMVALRYE